RRGIEGITDFHRRFGQDQATEESSEVAILRAMAKEVESRIPEDPVRRLKRDLAKAVEEERYEDAASIRDQLRHVTDRSSGDEQAP
ncbi:MAG TPA: UvrB/UvrC motif-containing protein, partial [Phycisphaerae bacterium]|nr:UvrB/UvrC motif-containing protein [Phycisphaerae bacterium]